MATLTQSYQMLGQAYLGSSYGDLYVRIYAKYNSQSIANNSSSVTYQSRAYFSGGYIISQAPTTATISGTNLSSSTNSYTTFEGRQDGYYYNGETILQTRTVTIPHNNDGTASISASANLNCGPWGWNNTASGSASLPTIPRKTDCPSLSAIVKTPTSLTISPKAANTFQHSLQIFYGNLSYYVNANGNMQSSEYKFGTNVTTIPITIPASFYSQFSGINGQGMLRLRTYNGNTYIDQSDATLYVKVNEDLCRPYINTYNIYDTNQKTIAITENTNDIIQYASRIQGYISDYYISDPDDTSTTITSKTIPSINYTIPSDDSILITNPTTNSFSVLLKNSRTITGQSEITTNGTLIPYIPLTFNIESLKRPEPTTGEIAISYNGNYYAQPFLEKECGYFVVGDTMTPNNTELYIPNDFYKQMDQNAHHTVFMVGSEYVVIDDTSVLTIDENTIEKSYNLAIYNSNSGTLYIPYEVNVRYNTNDGSTISVDIVSNVKTPLIGAGELTSVDTTNIFYTLIHNTEKDDVTFQLMNTLAITWQYREKGSNTWIDGGTLTPTINTQNNTYSGQESLGNDFDYQKQYEFQFVAEDLLFNSYGTGTDTNPINPIIVQDVVTRGLPILWWTDGSVHVLGDVYVSGTIYNGNSS